MNIYEFVELCKEDSLTASEAQDEWERYLAEKREQFLERYYNDPLVQEGWRQQDLIEMYRREK